MVSWLDVTTIYNLYIFVYFFKYLHTVVVHNNMSLEVADSCASKASYGGATMFRGSCFVFDETVAKTFDEAMTACNHFGKHIGGGLAILPDEAHLV